MTVLVVMGSVWIGLNALIVVLMLIGAREPRPAPRPALAVSPAVDRVLAAIGIVVHEAPDHETLEFPVGNGWNEDDILHVLDEIEGL